MLEQEKVHLETFDALLPQRRVRPTLLSPVWHVAGFALGAATALLGPRAAMACTVAVEETIDRHYAEQAAALEDQPEEAELRDTIERFRAEELEHRDIGLANEAEQAPGYPLLTAAVRAGSRAAIWISQRL
jgi:ubiquinone biosynthesis monooxygenase Coq7